MDILHHRPFFTCCSVFMLVCTVAPFLTPVGKWIVGGLILAGTLLFALWRMMRRKDSYRAFTAILAGVLACLALLRSHQSFDAPEKRYLQSLTYRTVQITGTVVDRRGSGGYFTAYAFSLESVNQNEADGLALLTCHYTADLQPGERVVMQATILPLSEVVGDGYSVAALSGDGYVTGLLSEDEKQVTVIERESGGLLVRAGELRRTLALSLHSLTGKSACGLPSALLLGDKTSLADNVQRDFARAGVSHLLAISGLHMTLLFGLLDGLLRLCCMAKRIRTILLSAGMLGYLILLGFPPSATRAAIMLGMTYLAYVFSEQSDSLTSLGLAGSLILAVTPYAISDAGFWMSFFATLGIVTLHPFVRAWLERLSCSDAHPLRTLIRADLIKLLTAVLVGLVAMSFTLFIVASVIGEMGILSPLSTLLLTPICAPVLLLSLICLALMGTAGGDIVGHVVGLLCRAMAELTAWMAEPSWVVVSLRHPAVFPLAVVMTVATLLLLVIRLPARRRMAVLLPILLGWMAVGGVLAAHHISAQDHVNVTYLQPSSVSEALVMVSGNQGFVCDLSNGSLSALSASALEAKRQGATELAVLMLTHYHTRTSGALSTLLNRETVRALWMPVPESAEEYDNMLSCAEKACSAGVPIYLFEPRESLRIFGGGEMTADRVWIPRSQQPVLLISLDVSSDETGKDRLLYCGSAVFESRLASYAAELFPYADTVIFGSHGPLLKASYGEDLPFSPNCNVILSAYGDAAVWFAPQNLPGGASMWLGQKRFVLLSD